MKKKEGGKTETFQYMQAYLAELEQRPQFLYNDVQISAHKTHTMNMKKILIPLSVFITVIALGGCQAPEPEGAPETAAPTEAGGIGAPTEVPLPGDAEKAAPAQPARNVPETTGSAPSEEGDLGAPSEADQQAMARAMEAEDAQMCAQISSPELREACEKNVGTPSVEDAPVEESVGDESQGTGN